LEIVANSEREFPAEWITESGVDVTEEFVRYARPLIGDDWVTVPLVGGIQRFARLQPIFAEQRLPAYVPVEHRN
jgi:6-phosphofructokinase 1